jgi:hypothetical protein
MRASDASRNGRDGSDTQLRRATGNVSDITGEQRGNWQRTDLLELWSNGNAMKRKQAGAGDTVRV